MDDKEQPEVVSLEATDTSEPQSAEQPLVTSETAATPEAAPEVKKKRFGPRPLIAVVAVILLLAGGAAYLLVMKDKPVATQTVQQEPATEVVTTKPISKDEEDQLMQKFISP